MKVTVILAHTSRVRNVMTIHVLFLVFIIILTVCQVTLRNGVSLRLKKNPIVRLKTAVVSIPTKT